MSEGQLPTAKTGLETMFGKMAGSRIALEVGTHSPWVSRQLESYGHEVIVANAHKVKLITQSVRKNDRVDARQLARLARMLRKKAPESDLRTWGLGKMGKGGKRAKKRAVARKLAVLLHHLWVTGEVYEFRMRWKERNLRDMRKRRVGVTARSRLIVGHQETGVPQIVTGDSSTPMY